MCHLWAPPYLALLPIVLCYSKFNRWSFSPSSDIQWWQKPHLTYFHNTGCWQGTRSGLWNRISKDKGERFQRVGEPKHWMVSFSTVPQPHFYISFDCKKWNTFNLVHLYQRRLGVQTYKQKICEGQHVKNQWGKCMEILLCKGSPERVILCALCCKMFFLKKQKQNNNKMSRFWSTNGSWKMCTWRNY